MAKKRWNQSKQYDAGIVITTQSPYGSHTDMVVDPAVFASGGAVANLKDNQVFCQDDQGYYITERSRLDNGLADPRRYSGR
jgi:hypothetical protein